MVFKFTYLNLLFSLTYFITLSIGNYQFSDLVCEFRYFDRSLNNGSFLHLTDIHVDPKYIPNSDPEALCHRTSPRKKNNVAGPYGAPGSRCDSPIELVNEAFQFIKRAFRGVDFVIYTGDSARHDRDKKLVRTTADIFEDHTRVVSYFEESFDLNRTLVIPTIGNNDVPSFKAASEDAHERFYKRLLDIWSRYKGLDIMTPGKAQESFLRGGYWVQTLPRAPTISIINLNTMLFYADSKETLDCDLPSSAGGVQLDWYEGTLKLLQLKEQKAYVMGHIPPKSGVDHKLYMKNCYRRFIGITGEHASSIAAVFWGHTNSDTISYIAKTSKSKYSFTPLVKHSDKKTRGEIVTVMTTGPSIIPVCYAALRHYLYHPDSGDLLGYTQFYANLTEANDHPELGLNFKEEYNTWTDYQMPALTINHWKAFIPRLVSSKPLWKLYMRHQSVGYAV